MAKTKICSTRKSPKNGEFLNFLHAFNCTDLILDGTYPPDSVDSKGNSIIHLITTPEIYKKLMLLATDINAKNDFGLTPLESLIFLYDADFNIGCIKLLIEAGAEYNLERMRELEKEYPHYNYSVVFEMLERKKFCTQEIFDESLKIIQKLAPRKQSMARNSFIQARDEWEKSNAKLVALSETSIKEYRNEYHIPWLTLLKMFRTPEIDPPLVLNTPDQIAYDARRVDLHKVTEQARASLSLFKTNDKEALAKGELGKFALPGHLIPVPMQSQSEQKRYTLFKLEHEKTINPELEKTTEMNSPS